jgi:ankyrin repeat protein
MRYLIDAGADVNATTPANETSLMLATYFYGSDRDGVGGENYEKAVRMLVEAGAKLENERASYTPLAYAAYQGHNGMVEYLLKRGARVDGGARNGVAYINTPLMMASMQGHRKTALLLLRAGADARVRVYHGHTAAELAEKHLGRDLVGILKCAEHLAPGEAFSQRCEGTNASAASYLH